MIAARGLTVFRRVRAPQGATCLCIFEQRAGFSVEAKIETFKKEISQYLPKDGQKVVFATAWLSTDNVFVALMHKHFPEVLKGMNLVAIDTCHLFPETLECAKLSSTLGS
jgi:hypothetical protein